MDAQTRTNLDKALITVALDDLDLAAMRVGFGSVCEIIDVGDIPIEVKEYSRMIDRGKYFYFSQIHDPDSFDLEGMRGMERMDGVDRLDRLDVDEGGLNPPGPDYD